MSGGWDESAAAWVESLGPGGEGDHGRARVLDPVMLGHARAKPARLALDIGCGEGRFCRMLAGEGIAAIGLDPTAALIAEARARDPAGRYLRGRAEALPFADAAFDLAVSYVTLVDIPDHRAAISEMARVLAPGGRLLIANLQGYASAAVDGGGRSRDAAGRYGFTFFDYAEARSAFTEWKGIRIRNYHRPLGDYMAAFLGAGLRLTAFEEPLPVAAETHQDIRNAKNPWFVMMVWEKPATSR